MNNLAKRTAFQSLVMISENKKTAFIARHCTLFPLMLFIALFTAPHAVHANDTGEKDFLLAVKYELGDGVEQDYTRAFNLFKQAAEKGHIRAQASMGFFYYRGRGGVEQNYSKARQLLEKAATHGFAPAQNILGIMYDSGHGVAQDYVMANKLFEKAAVQDDANAQTNLGLNLMDGNGVRQDYVQARQWFEKAAAQGNAIAQVRLGLLYRQGLGGSYDRKKALFWLEKAVEQKNADGQYHLGRSHYFGLAGLPRNSNKARELYELAAAQGHYDAQQTLIDPYHGRRRNEPSHEPGMYHCRRFTGNGPPQNSFGYTMIPGGRCL